MTQKTNPTAINLLNKVPEVTVFFWIIKMMSTTIGETGADYLNLNCGIAATREVPEMPRAVELVVHADSAFGRSRPSCVEHLTFSV